MDKYRKRLTTSLRARFVLGVAAMLLPLALLGASAFVSMRNMAAAFQEALDDPVQEMHTVMRLQSLVHRAAMPPNDYLIHGEKLERDKFSRLRASVDGAFNDALALKTLWPEQRRLLLLARTEWRRARKIAKSLLALPAPTGSPKAAIEMKRMDAYIDKTAAVLERAHTLTQRELDEAMAKARDIERQALVLIASGVGVLGLFIAIASGLLLARFVLAPLRALEIGAKRLSAGDFSHRVTAFPGDELGKLANEFNAMAEKLEQAQAELKELASHDGLTGLYNHRAFHDFLDYEVERAMRYKRPLSLLMLDLDHFKKVNDTYGHQAGDAALKHVSEVLKCHARAIDRVCRYGGEEFTMILPETDSVAAAIIAERLRLVVQQQSFDAGNSNTITITVSIGVATYPEQVDSAQRLVAAADTVLYAAKQGGRNCVACYEKPL
jgi:diguanylate cyclase (GGDEF)-like protein